MHPSSSVLFLPYLVSRSYVHDDHEVGSVYQPDGPADAKQHV
jgi:hypothetical protein